MGRPKGVKNRTPEERAARTTVRARRNRVGAPTKLTPEMMDEIVKLVEVGNYMETAAACVGVQPHTFRDWMRRGAREDKGLYYEFSCAVRKAEGQAEAAALVRIRQAGKQSWQADGWYLERKHPRKWGRWDRVDVTKGKEAEKTHPERDDGVVVYVPDNGRLPNDDAKS